MSRLGIFESISDAVAIADPAGRLIETNDAFDSFFGPRGPGTVEPAGSILEIWPELVEFWQPTIAANEAGRHLRVDVPATDSEGRRLVFDVRLFLTDGDDSVAGSIAVVARDVTADRERVKNLEVQATTDHLTGAFNRNQLEILLTQAIRSARRRKTSGCFLFLDIDQFKQINDKYGHVEGDITLKKVATVLKDNLRASDVVARFGGDEFGAVLPDSDQDFGLIKAQRLVTVLGEIKPADENVGMAVSIEIAVFPEHGDYASDIIRAADIAMYGAKRDPNRSVMVWEAGLSK